MRLRPVSIPVWDIEEWILNGDPNRPPFSPGSRVEVVGPLQLRGRITGQVPSLSGLLFLDDVDFQETHIDGPLDLSRCLFVKRLLLRNIEVSGELRLEDAEVLGRGEVVGGMGVSIDLTGARLDGGIIAARLNAGNVQLDASGATLGRSALLSGVRLRLLWAPGITIDGDLALHADVRGASNNIAVLRTEIDDIDLSIADIHGDVALTGLYVRNTLGLRNATVRGYFGGTVQQTRNRTDPLLRVDLGQANLSKVQIGGLLSLQGALVRSGLNLAGGSLRGGMQMTGVWIQDRGGFATEIRSLDLSGAKVDVGLLLRGVAIGQVNLTNAEIAGEMRIDCDVAWDSQDASTQEVRNELIESSLRSRNELWASVQLPKLSISPMSTNGFLRPSFGSIDGRDLKAHGGMYLSGMEVENNLILIGSNLRELWITPEDAFAPEISGELHLSAIRDPPYIVFEALKCRGELRILASELGPTHLRPGVLGTSVEPCSVGLLILENTNIAGPLILSHIQVDGRISNAGRRGIWIKACHISAELSFWRDSWMSLLQQSVPAFKLDGTLRPWDHGAGIIGSVTIEKCTIGGDCELTFLKALGPIEITDCEIGGDLLMRSLVTLRNVFPQFADFPMRLTQSQPVFRTVTPSLALRMTSVARDADLTGLTLNGYGINFWCEEEKMGHLDARYLKIKGDLLAYKFLKEQRHAAQWEAYFEVPGAFDLSSGEADHLVVSGHSFPGDGHPTDSVSSVEDEGLILTGGRFRRVTFPYINRSKDGCPVPTDLSDIEVEMWRIGNTNEGDEPSAEVYKHLLESDPRFRRSTYRSIESNLRNRGHEDAADEIYRAMYLRERRERREFSRRKTECRERRESSRRKRYGSFWRLLSIVGWPVRMLGWHLIWRYLLRFGTDPTRLVVVIFSLALISFPIYMQPKNIEPAPVILAMHPAWKGSEKGPVRGEAPQPQNWGSADATALLIRHHVPFLDVVLRQEWQLRDSPGFYYGPLPIRLGGLSAEDWAGLMSVLNMMMWPLLLAFFFRKLLRE